MGKRERAQPTRQNRKPADGLGRTESSAPTEVVVTGCRSTGRGGRWRWHRAEQSRPPLRRVVVTVCHPPTHGGGCHRVRRAGVVAPYDVNAPPPGKAGHIGPALRRNGQSDKNTVGAIHESPAARVAIPTQAGWIVSGNKIPPRLPLGGKVPQCAHWGE